MQMNFVKWDKIGFCSVEMIIPNIKFSYLYDINQYLYLLANSFQHSWLPVNVCSSDYSLNWF